VTKDGEKCHSGGGGRRPEFPLSESCSFANNDLDDVKYIIVIGDSHAGNISENLRRLAEANSYNFLQLTSAGCPHVKGIFSDGICAERSNQLVDFVSSYPHSIIVYSARVPLLLEIELFVNPEGYKEANHIMVPEDFVQKQFPTRANALVNTLDELKQIAESLVIVYPVPEQGFNVKDILFSNRKLIKTKEDLPTITTSYEAFKNRVKTSYETLDKVLGSNVFRVYPEELFCHEETGRCLVSESDNIYYSRDNHVSQLGSRLIVKQIAQELNMQVGLDQISEYINENKTPIH
jgi:hypothetical protein